MNKELKRIIIKRCRWLRGTGQGRLLNSQNKMCCLGFVCRSEGYASKEIREWIMPNDLIDSHKIIPTLVKSDGTGHCRTTRLAVINDDATITDSQREHKLTQLAIKAGYKFVFVP